MKKTLMLILGLLLILNTINAQQTNFTYEYGQATTDELLMTEYQADKDAEAVVLYEIGKYYFSAIQNEGLILNMEIETRIKILSQAGIKYAEFEIPYYEENYKMETVHEIQAITYNMEGDQIVRTGFEPKNVYDEKLQENWRVKKFALPNVKEGSVIDLKYTISTPFFFNMREWKFQKKIPVVYSKLEYKAIPSYEYIYILKGSDKLDEFHQEILPFELQIGKMRYKEVAVTFGMKNLPAFRDEEFITSEKDYMVSLNFQVAAYNAVSGARREMMSTWPQICDGLLKEDEFGKYLDASKKVAKKILPTLNLQEKSEKEKLEEIVRYVKMNYNWNGVIAKYAFIKPSELEKKKVGNSADINLFLVGMFKEAGFDVAPVVLSTRRNGQVNKDYPFVHFLNYVIAQVKTSEGSYFLDGTDSFLSFGELPTRCVNVQGLVVKPKSSEWISIEQKEVALTKYRFDIKSNDQQSEWNVDMGVTASAYDAYYYRTIYQGDSDNLVQLFKDRDLDISGDIQIDNYQDTEKPFEFSFSSVVPTEQVDNKLFVSPFLDQSQTENIFKQSKRTLSVDLILLHVGEYESNIEIPEGYEVEFLPEGKESDNRVMKYYYFIEQKENKLFVKAGYWFKRNNYQAKEYPILRVSYGAMVDKFNESIVLKKKQ